MALCGLVLGAQAMMAGVTGSPTALNDFCFALDGSYSSTSCNGADNLGGNPFPNGGNIDLSAFDLTASPSANSLGTVTFNLGAGSNQFVEFYTDYDLDQ